MVGEAAQRLGVVGVGLAGEVLLGLLAQGGVQVGGQRVECAGDDCGRGGPDAARRERDPGERMVGQRACEGDLALALGRRQPHSVTQRGDQVGRRHQVSTDA
ncbi:hypothetical protein [Nocardioides sp. CER19]|uniref:hypothetical protein n=1 Tax=Nocardioides sp. CER19 TaxID=3038538 RepID=UPI00244D3767|nr:hypothetical protein [Nocardioides sp. CER19]MDH2413615.1 hypothetical protein [Nocardioides sp. CER19]